MPLKSIKYVHQSVGTRPEAVKVFARDFLKQRSSKVKDAQSALQGVADWLLLAQENAPAMEEGFAGGGGFSSGYNLKTGKWRPVCHATTGFAIVTLLQCAAELNNEIYKTKALEAADWLVRVQCPDGSFTGGALPGRPQPSLVFDTAQAVKGLLEAIKVTGNDTYVEAATSAVEWLCSVRNPMGPWVRGSYNGLPHTYYARVANVLAQFGKHFNHAEAMQHAEGFCDWVLTCQSPNGFFEHMGFTPMEPIWTHAIGFTLKGLIEVGEILERPEFIDVTVKGAEELQNIYGSYGHLPGGLDRSWAVTEQACCLSGQAQIACVWFLLARLRGKPAMKATAAAATQQLMQWQEPSSGSKMRAGALTGSYPAYRGYQVMACPTWAAKFFASALFASLK